MANKKENVPAKAVESLFNKVSNLIDSAPLIPTWNNQKVVFVNFTL